MTTGTTTEASPPDLTAAIGSGMTAAVPFARTLGVVFREISPDHAVVVLPDRGDLHNHVGGPHAGVLFSLAETASGAVVLAAFGTGLDRWTPLAYHAEASYRAVATGEVSAEATLGRPADEVRAEFDATGKAKFPVSVTVRDAAETITTEVTVTWALRANR